MTDFPDIKIKALVSFPGTMLDGVGVNVVKSSGTYQINLAYEDFAPPVGVVSDPSHQNVLLWNSITQAYTLTPISSLGGGGGAVVTPSALTRTDDANVTLTLGGTPATALLQATSITVGWNGTLSTVRGGFGADISAQSGVPVFTTGAATFAATTGTGNIVRAASPILTGTPRSSTTATAGAYYFGSGGTGNLAYNGADTFTFTGAFLIDGNGAQMKAVGYANRTGISGAYSGNAFSIDFVTTSHLWVDATNLGQIAFTSDYRIKKDVMDLPGMWDTVKALRPIKYTQAEFSPPSHLAYLEQMKRESRAVSDAPLFVADNTERWGFIAHELQEAMIGSAATGVKDQADLIQSPNPFTVIAALTKALQEAMARIEALEATR